MSDEFPQRYLGEFPEDKILKALKKSYIAVADKDHKIFLAQSAIRQGIESIKHGANSEEVLCAVLSSMGSLINELHKQALVANLTRVQPIYKSKDSND